MKASVNVLGTKYDIVMIPKNEDEYLSECNGYTDWTINKIVIRQKDETCELTDFRRYLEKTVRHELIHAFLFESGLAENFEHRSFGHEETMVDWFAFQSPKIEACVKKVMEVFDKND